MRTIGALILILALSGCNQHENGSEATREGKNSDRLPKGTAAAKGSTRRLTQEQLAGKSSGELAILWEESAAGELNSNELALYRLDLLKRLIETEGLEAALPLVCSLPSGTVRHGLVEAAFKFSNQPLVELMEVRSRLNEQDQEAAFLELEFQARTKGKYTLNDLKGIDLREGRNSELLSAVTSCLMKDLQSSNGFDEKGKRSAVNQVFQDVLALYKEGKVSGDHARKAAGELVKSPFNCWSLLNSGQEGAQELLGPKRDAIVSGMARQNPLAAIEKLKSSTVPNDNDLRTVFATWLRSDESAPKAWLESNRSALSGSSLSYISSAIATEAAEGGHIEEAERWLEAVHSADLHKEVRNTINSKRTEQILEQVKTKPKEVMASLLAGSKDIPDGVVFKAYQSWSSQDGERAYEWFSSEAETMKIDDRNEIAKFYAEKALKDGDVERAQEWLQVVDHTP